ncbi:hypothetical protein, partial [Parendozoicomonas sp. Alg238-R29]|uniref:hypothetical protein n=1 Tax=Parendozoicomonas sp. Alg238-R29 TaxID=2993446 RepID=UPI00248F30F9
MPEFAEMLHDRIPLEHRGGSEDFKEVNRKTVQFLRSIESRNKPAESANMPQAKDSKAHKGQIPSYEVGSIIDSFTFKEPASGELYPVKAKVIGLGTSTVVFQFNEFDNPDENTILTSLNHVLPKFAFRRIYFTSENHAIQFYHHQTAQVKFLKEQGIDILPVQFWRSEHATVWIAQPLLKSDELLETHFEK